MRQCRSGLYWTSDLDLACYHNPHLWLALGVGLPGLILISIGAPVFSWVWLRCVCCAIFRVVGCGCAGSREGTCWEPESGKAGTLGRPSSPSESPKPDVSYHHHPFPSCHRRHQHKLYTSPSFGVSYGFLYEDYNRNCYYWWVACPNISTSNLILVHSIVHWTAASCPYLLAVVHFLDCTPSAIL